MYSLIAERRDLLRKIEALQKRLDHIEASPAYQEEAQFLERLHALMDEHEMYTPDVLGLLSERPGKKPSRRKKRESELKVFTNPHTGETISAYRTNKRKLQEWMDEYGQEIVLSWQVE